MRLRNSSLIPRNKPKSVVIFFLVLLFSICVAAPIAWAGVYLELGSMKSFGIFLSFMGILAALICLSVYFAGVFSGKYKNIQDQEWNKQLW